MMRFSSLGLEVKSGRRNPGQLDAERQNKPMKLLVKCTN